MLTLNSLHEPTFYAQQIEKICMRLKSRGGLGTLYSTKDKGVPLFSFYLDRHRLAKAIAESVRREEFQLSPPTQRLLINQNQKKKLIYDLSCTDKIVVGSIAALLTQLFEPFLSPHLYSYKKGIGHRDLVIAQTRYIRKEQKRGKGIYLILTDIASYGDTINVQDNSSLWKQIAALFDVLQIQPTDYQWNLLRSAIRPAYGGLDGTLRSNLFGVPVGSPITPLINNLYVSGIDPLIAQIPLLFYGRYSDDIVLCHPDPEVVSAAFEELKRYLTQLNLQLNPSKTKWIYLSPAGNRGVNENWQGTNSIKHLGFQLNGHGSYSPAFVQQKYCLRQLRSRLEMTMALLPKMPVEECGVVLSQTINSAFLDPIMGHDSFKRLVYDCNDHAQLKHLDYLIALAIAETVTGIRGVKAFREIPYRKIRSDWNLLSLVRLKANSMQVSNPVE